VAFFLNKNVFIALVAYKISIKYYYIYIRDPQFLIRKFNSVSWIVTIVFYNVTGISEVKPGSDWAKGLHLQNLRRT
jgi:hypothetical protein